MIADVGALAPAPLAGCQAPGEDVDGAFYDGDGRAVHCALGLDTVTRNSLASIDTALDRAAARGEVVELYAHDPGRTVEVETLAHVLEGATARGLPFVTYAAFARGGVTGPGLALSFDDTSISSWYALRPLLQQHAARVTFFVSRYHKVDTERRALLHELAADGHDIEAHSVLHLRAPEYVEDFGVEAYLADEVRPSIEILRADGFEISAFAYPFGARTGELDHALLAEVPLLRSVSFSYTGVIASPCPR